MAPRLLTLILSIGLLTLSPGIQGATQSVGLTGPAFDAWSLTLGREFPGAHGNLWQTPWGASFVGEFWNGGAYVSIIRAFAEPVDVKSVTLEIQAPQVATLGFRITDSTGQTFQQRLSLQATTNWQRVVIQDLVGKQEANSWGGAKDGKWHGPAKSIALLLDKSALRDRDLKQGKINLKTVELGLP